MVRSVHNHEVINDVSMSRVKLIERYGVSVYDLNKMPEDLKNGVFNWQCKITTRDRRLLNVIQFEI